eukprot:TRINITY_DN1967_c0_g1_i13.p2 TRINITY_DN1967_c0_g1~~TRINITY_DN1967_c0_g1_i13.p2  ORF type:complete len:191 (+),score=25.39 TRINITY_DN1967_c0_g1_i13:556-1128(+)
MLRPGLSGPPRKACTSGRFDQPGLSIQSCQTTCKNLAMDAGIWHLEGELAEELPSNAQVRFARGPTAAWPMVSVRYLAVLYNPCSSTLVSFRLLSLVLSSRLSSPLHSTPLHSPPLPLHSPPLPFLLFLPLLFSHIPLLSPLLSSPIPLLSSPLPSPPLSFSSSSLLSCVCCGSSAPRWAISPLVTAQRT